jgi:hypothetical protein
MLVSSEAIYTSRSKTHKLCAGFLRAAGTPVARSLLEGLVTGNYTQIIEAEINPDDYMSPESFAVDYCAVSLLRKYPLFPLGIKTAEVAIGKFLDSEAACKATNLSKVRPYVIPPERAMGLTPESYISYARNKIRSLLGQFDWNAAAERFAFSGGASTRLKRKSGAPYYKFQGKPEVTRNCALLATTAIRSIPLWRSEMEANFGPNPCDWVKIVDGSKVTTVAKSAKTDRCIAIEPDMNMFVQKGIGSLIRTRLKSVGIDLNDQTHNQKLARIGSSTGSLVTIDLASASDSIALELVRLMMPPDWFEALCLCRSEYGILPGGRKHLFEKISSMGNGYTFELESLIFWALSRAVLDLNDVSDRRLGIYGDDIVIHNSCAEVLIELLDYCGFKTNVEKTFLSGPFRESCGKHYFYGRDVTPFYVKAPLDTIQRTYWFGNSLRLWTSRLNCPESYQSFYSYVLKTVDRKHRYLVPMSLGSDCGFWASFDEARPSYHMGRQSFHTKLLRSRRQKHRPDGVAAVLHWFNMNGGELGSSGVQLEKGEVRYYHSKVYLSWWDPAPCGVSICG